MDKILYFFLMILCFSCDSDDESSTPAINTFTAEIDGQVFDSDIATTSNIASIFVLSGVKGESFIALSFIIPSNLTLEAIQYESNGGDCNPIVMICSGISYADGNDPQGANFQSAVDEGNSVITIDELNFTSGGRVQGTFSGRVYNEDENTFADINNGEFNLIIQ